MNRSIKSIVALLTATLLAISLSAQAADFAVEAVVLPGDVIDGKTIVDVLPMADVDNLGNATFVANYTDLDHPDPADPGRGVFVVAVDGTTPPSVVAVEGETLLSVMGAKIVSAEVGPMSFPPRIAGDVVAFGATNPTNFTIHNGFRERDGIFMGGDWFPPSLGGIAGYVDINSSATVIAQGGFAGLISLLKVTSDNTMSVIASNGDVVDGETLGGIINMVALSDTGQAAFLAGMTHPGTGSHRNGVLLGANFGDVRFIQKPGDPLGTTGMTLDGALSGIAVNSLDEVAYLANATRADGSNLRGIFTANDQIADRLVVHHGQAVEGIGNISLGDMLAINASGDIAYVASAGLFAANLNYLFVNTELAAGPGTTTTDELITLTRVRNRDGRRGIGINDAMEVAFAASYMDGAIEKHGLFIATGVVTDVDSDGDGVFDADDSCPAEDASGYDLNGDGCIDDTDSDGVFDNVDLCPTENASGFDSNGDGCIDNLSGLGDVLDTLVEAGVISEEVQGSLVSKIENATKSADKDNICAGVHAMIAFKNQIEAQRGKKISQAAADDLIAYADNVIAGLEAELPAGGSC